MSVPAAAEHEPADVALLTGPEAGPMLEAALATEGARLGRWAVHTVHHRPGAGVTVGYTATVVRHAQDAEGHEEYLCATTARLSRTDVPALVRLESADGGPVVHLWRHPADPELPALAVACDAAQLTERLGITVSVELLTYRPTRRAVLRVRQADGATAYAKVVRPDTLDALAERHRMLTRAGVPAPEVLRADDDGLVLLAEGRGTPLANLLARQRGAELDDPSTADRTLGTLVTVLDAMPADVTELPRRPAWSERARHYAHAAATVLPEHRPRTELLADGIEEMLARSDPGPVVPTHGDFYEANL
ncbi:aminoglycoside phosphotransferase family protein, partial [Georgenia sp. 10Sc9-8]|nr:aminoglycoside phosphotransferase family protein [Georgenia halotolerans]